MHVLYTPSKSPLFTTQHPDSQWACKESCFPGSSSPTPLCPGAVDMSIYLLPSHHSTEPVSAGAPVEEGTGETVVTTIQKTRPSLSQLSFYLESLSFTPQLAGDKGLDVPYTLVFNSSSHCFLKKCWVMANQVSCAAWLWFKADRQREDQPMKDNVFRAMTEQTGWPVRESWGPFIHGSRRGCWEKHHSPSKILF